MAWRFAQPLAQFVDFLLQFDHPDDFIQRHFGYGETVVVCKPQTIFNVARNWRSSS
jgi:hypothetical protein